jgi:hypothetical protein
MAIAFATGVLGTGSPNLALAADKSAIAVFLPQRQVVVEEVGDREVTDKGFVQKRPLGRRRIPLDLTIAL